MQWANSTNKGSALLKLIHQFEDAPIFHDEIVQIFFNESEQAIAHQLFEVITSDSDTEEAQFLRYAYAYVNLREKHGDDAIAQAIKSGCQQILLLGSGYDTRFFRLPEIQENQIPTFEVDLVQTIQAKKLSLTQVFNHIPDLLTLIDIDFNQQPLRRIFEFGFQPTLPTAFIWQGVSYYLAKDYVSHVLNDVRSLMVEPSLFVFDCCTPLMTFKNEVIPGIADNINKLNQIGEPYRFGMYPDELVLWLKKKGFHAIEIQLLSELEHHAFRQTTLPDNGWYIVVAHA